jgi:predicted nucleic acid-binding protein
MYIFDTDTLSNIVKSSPSPLLLRKLADLPAEFQHTTSINAAEIYYGAHRSPSKLKILKVFHDTVFPNLTILPFDELSARVYGELRAKLEKKGFAKSEPDLRIAAIALHHRFTLVTGNTRHFQGIARLKIENWIG